MQKEQPRVLVGLNRERDLCNDVLVYREVQVTQPCLKSLVRREDFQRLLLRTQVHLDALCRCCHLHCLLHVELVLDSLKSRQYDQAVLLDVYDCLKLALDQSVLHSTHLLVEVCLRLLDGRFCHVLVFYHNRLELLVLLERVTLLHVPNLHVNLMSVVY
jgi:hypothetical protein